MNASLATLLEIKYILCWIVGTVTRTLCCNYV